MTVDRWDLLTRHAADLRLDIGWAALDDQHRGHYLDNSGTIVLNRSLTRRQATATLAHELGHAVFGDRRSTPAIERRAWEYGASLAISPTEYAAAERIVGHHPAALAIELDVTPPLIEAWRRWYATRWPAEQARDSAAGLDSEDGELSHRPL